MSHIFSCYSLLLLIIYLSSGNLSGNSLYNSSTFEYEKSKNIELVDQMKIKEKNLIAMAREVEVLQAEILNAEKRANGNFLTLVCCFCTYI